MLVFHIGQKRYANDLTGKGAELHGGRWNQIGIPCIYTAGTRALGLLEYAANIKLSLLTGNLAITTYELPDDCWEACSTKDLPDNWQERPFPMETAAFGSNLLQKRKNPVIQVPSVIVPEEFNYLLNPLHPDFSKVKIVAINPLEFDTRIKR